MVSSKAAVRIGLTGGIAAGKSTVARMLEACGALLIDYDVLAHEATAPGSPALQRIRQHFGAEALSADGSLNRAWLAREVFASNAGEAQLAALNALVHPEVYRMARAREDALLQASERQPMQTHEPLIIVHDVPLLAQVQASLPFAFDYIVTVEAPIALRVKRMIATRAMTREEALARIAHQASAAQRLAIADAVIDAHVSLDAMRERVDSLYQQWLHE